MFMSINKNDVNFRVKTNTNPADAQSESVATSFPLGHNPESSTKEKAVSSQPPEQLQPPEEALVIAESVLHISLIYCVDSDNLFAVCKKSDKNGGPERAKRAGKIFGGLIILPRDKRKLFAGLLSLN
jgi:hypothetical protein